MCCNDTKAETPINETGSETSPNKQFLLDQRYLKMAAIWAQNSYCKRRQVGALLVKDKMIISDGYNGTPSGFENNCEDEIAEYYFNMFENVHFHECKLRIYNQIDRLKY
jgi:deoxycytidylate deaminase